MGFGILLKPGHYHGRTWRDLPVLHAGPRADSSLGSLAEREIGCLYERGEQRRYEHITFAHLALP